MLTKVALLAAALTLSVPAFAGDPSKTIQTNAQRGASKSALTGASELNRGFRGSSKSPAKSGAKKGAGNNAINVTGKGGGTSLATIGGSSGGNGTLIGGTTIAEVNGAKADRADARKQAQPAHGVKHGNRAPTRKLEVDPPQK